MDKTVIPQAIRRSLVVIGMRMEIESIMFLIIVSK